MTAYIRPKTINKCHYCRGVSLLSFLVCSAVIMLVFLYLWQTNSLVSHDFTIKKHKQQIEELSNSTQKMEMAAANIHSPANLESLVQQLNMVEVDKVIYISEDRVVAVK